MAILHIKKKKNIVKRAWMRFTNILRSKVRDLQFAALVRDSTNRLLNVISRRLVVPFKTRYLQNTSTRTNFNNYYGYGHDRRQRSRFFELFSRPLANTKCIRRRSERNYLQACEYQSQRWRQGAIMSKEKVLRRKKDKKEEEGPHEIVDSVEDAWRRVVASSPHLRVDERAGEFIYEFKEKMRMEKERSLLEFQERLKRSA